MGRMKRASVWEASFSGNVQLNILGTTTSIQPSTVPAATISPAAGKVDLILGVAYAMFRSHVESSVGHHVFLLYRPLR